MRRALVVLGAAGALLTVCGGATARAEIDWKSLPYFEPIGLTLKVSTNEGWRGARKVHTGRFDPQSDSTFPRVKREYIWSASCGSDEQRVSFSTTFLSPGTPYDGRLDLNYGVGNQFYGGRPYHSATISVNGTEFGRLGDIARFPRKVGPWLSLPTLPKRAVAAVHYGTNTVVIRVDRAALKRGEQCTKPAATSGGNVRYIGIFADLTLGYAADVRVRTPDVGKEHREVANGQPASIQGTSRFTNEGPGSALYGTFSVSVTGPGQSALAIAQPAPPLKDCEKSQAQITCHFDEIKPGQTTGIQILAGTQVNYGYFRNGAATMTLQWSVTARGRDPNGSNNSTQLDLVLCAPGATDPGCSG